MADSRRTSRAEDFVEFSSVLLPRLARAPSPRTGSLFADHKRRARQQGAIMVSCFHIHLLLFDRVISVAHYSSLGDSGRINKDTESLTISKTPGPCSPISAISAMLALFCIGERQLTPSSYERVPFYLCGYIPTSRECLRL